MTRVIGRSQGRTGDDTLQGMSPQSPARLAVVTGASSGVGLAAARILLDRGWTVLGIARRAAPLTDERYQRSTVPHAPTRLNGSVVSYQPGVVETPMQVQARGRSIEEFPWVGIFKDFEARGIAVPPEKPATQIADFLDQAGLSPFTEASL